MYATLFLRLFIFLRIDGKEAGIRLVDANDRAYWIGVSGSGQTVDYTENWPYPVLALRRVLAVAGRTAAAELARFGLSQSRAFQPGELLASMHLPARSFLKTFLTTRGI
jgi:hypothetical protein